MSFHLFSQCQANCLKSYAIGKWAQPHILSYELSNTQQPKQSKRQSKMDRAHSHILVSGDPSFCFPDTLKHHWLPVVITVCTLSQIPNPDQFQRAREVQKKLIHFSTEIAFPKSGGGKQFLKSEFFSYTKEENKFRKQSTITNFWKLFHKTCFSNHKIRITSPFSTETSSK